MFKQLLGTLIGLLLVTGIASATVMIETDPATDTSKPNVLPTTTTKPTYPTYPTKLPYTRSSRPSLRDVLERRPSLPASTNGVKKDEPKKVEIEDKTQSPVDTQTGTQTNTNTQNSTDTTTRTVVQQDAEAVKAYREERGYITRFLKRPANNTERTAINEIVQTAIKTLLATREDMRREYELAASSSSLMTEETWNTKAEATLNTYSTTLESYIDDAKMEVFEKFILGRTNLLKNYFDKLETIRKVKSQ